MGWRGMLIEPNPRNYASMVQHRWVSCSYIACTSAPAEALLLLIDPPATLSTATFASLSGLRMSTSTQPSAKILQLCILSLLTMGLSTASGRYVYFSWQPGRAPAQGGPGGAGRASLAQPPFQWCPSR